MGPGMMGGYQEDVKAYQTFMDDTAGMRKELHNKMFQYSEAYRNPQTNPETVTQLEKEIKELQKKIYEKAPR
jgi:peptidoglycan hydrolase CwlO-like protein